MRGWWACKRVWLTESGLGAQSFITRCCVTWQSLSQEEEEQKLGIQRARHRVHCTAHSCPKCALMSDGRTERGLSVENYSAIKGKGILI
jgi:hypothetical protein